MRIRSALPLLAALGAVLAYGQPKVVAVNIDRIVHPITVELVSHALNQAKTEHAALVLIRLNTPGGLMDATRGIVERIVASPIPVVTYVTPSGARAASAGFFVLEAGDVAAMAPGTNTGAASPVILGQQMDPVMRKKIESDASAWLRSVTSRRGRNSDLAQQTISDAKAFTEKEALEQHLIELIASDERALLSQLDGREITRWDGSKLKLQCAGAVVEEIQETPREWLMSILADPNLAFILLVLGAFGLYIEFTHPGGVFPGVAGGILLLLGLSGLSVMPINWVGAALLVLALGLFLLEVKVTSHGVLGVGGAVAMALGATLLVNGPPEMRIRLATALGVSAPFALITVFLLSLALKARASKAITGTATMVNEIGVAQTPLMPQGQIMVRGEYWKAVSAIPVPEGARVKILRVAGLTLEVEPWA